MGTGMNANTKADLAVDGGSPVRDEPMPPRRLIGDAEKQAVDALFDAAIESGNAFGYGGPAEAAYEEAFTDFMGGGYADGVNSGSNAVFCALGALKLPPFSEVIVPPITDPGGVMPVPLLGLIPMVADAAPGSYNTSIQQIEPLVNERTSAILVAHIGGEPVDMDPILELAERHRLRVVEDCAQAHGARYKGRLVGTFGDTAAFSTMFGKHHCTGGQGGVVYSTDESLSWEGRRFADRGKPFGLEASGNVRAGLNCNLNDLSATIGLAQIRKLPSIIEGRRRVGEALKERLGSLRAVSLGPQIDEIEPVYWFVRVRLDLQALSVSKREFCRALSAEGIPVNPSYRFIPCEAPWFRDQAVLGENGFPWTAAEYTGDRSPEFDVRNAVRSTEEQFNVAIHENYTDREIDDIVAALAKVEAAYLR